MRETREGIPTLQASCGRELAIGNMENRCELLINLVNDGKPKDAERLGPKGRWTGYGARLSPYTVVAPPGKRQLLPPQGHFVERGKPDSLLPEAGKQP